MDNPHSSIRSFDNISCILIQGKTIRNYYIKFLNLSSIDLVEHW